MKKTLASLAVLAALICAPAIGQNMLKQGNAGATPDSWLLARRGPKWWYDTQPSITPVQLQNGTPTAAEQVVIDRARYLFANRPA